jgi:hypothetical protein
MLRNFWEFRHTNACKGEPPWQSWPELAQKKVAKKRYRRLVFAPLRSANTNKIDLIAGDSRFRTYVHKFAGSATQSILRFLRGSHGTDEVVFRQESRGFAASTTQVRPEPTLWSA